MALWPDASQWRRYAIALTRALHTPWRDVLAMPWDEALLCLVESQELEAESGSGQTLALLHQLIGAMR